MPAGLPFSIALCCNGSLLPGLYATLASLTASLGRRDEVALHLFITGIDAATQEKLRQTVSEAGGVGDFQIHEADEEEFHGFNSLYGNRTVYQRLKLPDLLPEATTILYLDSDLIVHADVCELFALPLGSNPLGAIFGETVVWSIDHDIFRKLGLNDDDRCFNSGVLLINAAVWRETGVTARAFEFARTNPTLLRSYDQTILNAFFSRSFYELPKRFNTIVSPENKTLEAADGIYHFMGSPKPWDPFGNLIHGNWRMWKNVIRRTRFRWSDFLLRHPGAYAVRAWSLRFSYARVMLRKTRSLLRRGG